MTTAQQAQAKTGAPLTVGGSGSGEGGEATKSNKSNKGKPVVNKGTPKSQEEAEEGDESPLVSPGSNENEDTP